MDRNRCKAAVRLTTADSGWMRPRKLSTRVSRSRPKAELSEAVRPESFAQGVPLEHAVRHLPYAQAGALKGFRKWQRRCGLQYGGYLIIEREDSLLEIIDIVKRQQILVVGCDSSMKTQ